MTSGTIVGMYWDEIQGWVTLITRSRSRINSRGQTPSHYCPIPLEMIHYSTGFVRTPQSKAPGRLQGPGAP